MWLYNNYIYVVSSCIHILTLQVLFIPVVRIFRLVVGVREHHNTTKYIIYITLPYIQYNLAFLP